MTPRLAEEIQLLKQVHEGLDHLERNGEDWFLVQRYPFPPGWRIGNREISHAPICFVLNASYPAGEPYGFLAPAGINFKGSPPGNPGSPKSPPFPGEWQHFSWAPENWEPHAEVASGSNLLAWVRSFGERLRGGA